MPSLTGFDCTDFSLSTQSKLIVDMGDIRDVCLEPWRSDYLIQSYYDPFSQSMCLLAGTQR